MNQFTRSFVRGFVIVAALLAPARHAVGQFVTCDTNCDDKCRINLLIGNVVEPACKSSGYWHGIAVRRRARQCRRRSTNAGGCAVRAREPHQRRTLDH